MAALEANQQEELDSAVAKCTVPRDCLTQSH